MNYFTILISRQHGRSASLNRELWQALNITGARGQPHDKQQARLEIIRTPVFEIVFESSSQHSHLPSSCFPWDLTTSNSRSDDQNVGAFIEARSSLLRLIGSNLLQLHLIFKRITFIFNIHFNIIVSSTPIFPSNSFNYNFYARLNFPCMLHIFPNTNLLNFMKLVTFSREVCNTSDFSSECVRLVPAVLTDFSTLFFSLSSRVLGYLFYLDHECFLPNLFQFILLQSYCNPTLCILDTESCVKLPYQVLISLLLFLHLQFSWQKLLSNSFSSVRTMISAHYNTLHWIVTN